MTGLYLPESSTPAVAILLTLVTAVLPAACGPERDEPAAAGDTLAPLPASFIGILPCADCPGIEYRLDLFPESAFYLRQSYLERGLAIDEIGSWNADPETATLAVWGSDIAPTQFRIVDADTLRLLDREGGDIESELNYALNRQAGLDPVDLTLPLRGMYSYMADTGNFVECQSGRRFAVAAEGDNAALERGYLAARREPGEPLLASFDGRVTLRPPMEGTGMRPTVIVDRFTGIWPVETCGARMSRSELRGTNWVLTRIGEQAVALAEGEREARLVLDAGDNRVSGFGGCNTFSGTYEIAGGSIAFGPLAATRRACLDGGEHETGLFAALESSASYELGRHHLELYDAGGGLLARFEARALE